MGQLPCRQNGTLNKNIASAGNRTRINCLEGSYADHYTTDAVLIPLLSKGPAKNQLAHVSLTASRHEELRWTSRAIGSPYPYL